MVVRTVLKTVHEITVDEKVRLRRLVQAVSYFFEGIWGVGVGLVPS